MADPLYEKVRVSRAFLEVEKPRELVQLKKCHHGGDLIQGLQILLGRRRGQTTLLWAAGVL